MCCVGINSTSSGKSPSKAKFGNSEKASELAILTVFDKLNNCFFIVSLDYELKLTMQIVHPGLLTRSETMARKFLFLCELWIISDYCKII
jgi:hypothetical protein